MLFFVAWIGGIAGAIGEVFSSTAITNAGTISQLLLPTDALWRGSVYELEPVLYRDVLGATTERAGNPFFVQSPPSVGFLVWSVVLGGADRGADGLEPPPPRGVIPRGHTTAARQARVTGSFCRHGNLAILRWRGRSPRSRGKL